MYWTFTKKEIIIMPFQNDLEQSTNYDFVKHLHPVSESWDDSDDEHEDQGDDYDYGLYEECRSQLIVLRQGCL